MDRSSRKRKLCALKIEKKVIHAKKRNARLTVTEEMAVA